MSFRELRTFTEVMRTLGYPRPISMDNFRTPNFPLVADILYWLVLRYDPSAKVPDDIDTEGQRVAFLTAAGQVVANKARLVLKTKSLYCADGRAVRELLKLANILLGAVRAAGEGAFVATGGVGDEDPTMSPHRLAPLAGSDFLATIRPADLAASRAMASRITERGARLHELLRREVEGGVREARTSALNFLDRLSGSLLGGGSGGGGGGGEVERFELALADATAAGKERVAALEREAADLGEDERALSGKLKKRRGELERAQKRLASLHSVRPAFMDDYERLEVELGKEYEAYIIKYRNLDALQRELSEAEAREVEAVEGSAQALRQLQKRLREEEARVVRGDEEEGGSGGGGGGGGGGGALPPLPQSSATSRWGESKRAEEGGGGGVAATLLQQQQQRAAAAASASQARAAAAAAAAAAAGPARVSGSMNAPDSDEDESLDSAEMNGEEEEEEEEEGEEDGLGLNDF